MKTKKELVLVTYWDYLRHFGREDGRKKWKEHKAKDLKIDKGEKEKIYESKPVEVKLEDNLEPTATIEEVRVEEVPLEKAKGNIRYRADKVRDTIKTIGWREYIRPRIQMCIDLYKSVYDDVPSYEELKVNQAVRKELKAILQDIDGWIIADLELKKEEKDAANSRRKKGTKSDDSQIWQSER